MNTLQKMQSLSKPENEVRIPLSTIGYIRSLSRSKAHEFVLKAFLASGKTQAEIASQLGKRPEVISRLLGAPGNWRLDTLGDLLFAISGEVVEISSTDPFAGVAKNYRAPEWMEEKTPIDVFENTLVSNTGSSTLDFHLEKIQQ